MVLKYDFEISTGLPAGWAGTPLPGSPGTGFGSAGGIIPTHAPEIRSTIRARKATRTGVTATENRL
ncbi:hypothetical protein GCM10009097_17010 [Pigmentiphaga daeguensis]|uniref:Uncharacterized protein n=1 Tax=Pigmentiphaga daeguensis TaxID=414049 RepID=A0ABN1BM58_9BURK